MGIQVEISARLIRWPQQCACCLGYANEEYQTSHTRVTGKRVIRSNSRSWKVPYCRGCLDHVDAEDRARSIGSSSASTVLVVGILLGLAVGFFGSCCCGGVILSPSQSGSGEPVTVGGVLMILASIMLGIMLVVGAIFWSRQLAADARRRRREAQDYAESLASRHCCTLGPAVTYEGWYGSVHTFWFASPHYADAFIQANPGKILRG